MRFAVTVFALGVVGCADTGPYRSASGILSKAVEVPGQTEAVEATAARVYEVGRKIAVANPFTGLDPSFQTVGHKELLLFHRDQYGVFISDTLAERCKSEGELAAVLCTELGKMVAEQRNSARMGFTDPLPNIGVTSSGEAGGIPADQVRVAELALREKKDAKDRGAANSDPRKIAADLMKSAGYGEADLDAVAPLLKTANKDRAILKQFGGPGAAPTWSN